MIEALRCAEFEFKLDARVFKPATGELALLRSRYRAT